MTKFTQFLKAGEGAPPSEETTAIVDFMFEDDGRSIAEKVAILSKATAAYQASLAAKADKQDVDSEPTAKADAVSAEFTYAKLAKLAKDAYVSGKPLAKALIVKEISKRALEIQKPGETAAKSFVRAMTEDVEGVALAAALKFATGPDHSPEDVAKIKHLPGSGKASRVMRGKAELIARSNPGMTQEAAMGEAHRMNPKLAAEVLAEEAAEAAAKENADAARSAAAKRSVAPPAVRAAKSKSAANDPNAGLGPTGRG